MDWQKTVGDIRDNMVKTIFDLQSSRVGYEHRIDGFVVSEKDSVAAQMQAYVDEIDRLLGRSDLKA